jgi:hypothetical protein
MAFPFLFLYGRCVRPIGAHVADAACLRSFTAFLCYARVLSKVSVQDVEKQFHFVESPDLADGSNSLMENASMTQPDSSP